MTGDFWIVMLNVGKRDWEWLDGFEVEAEAQAYADWLRTQPGCEGIPVDVLRFEPGKGLTLPTE